MIVVEFTCPSCSVKWRKTVRAVPARTDNVLCSDCRRQKSDVVKHNVESDRTCQNCNFWYSDNTSNQWWKKCFKGHCSDHNGEDLNKAKKTRLNLTYFTDGCKDFEVIK